MRKNNDFLGRLCHLYLIGMTVLLPLYTGGTYANLGDTKYILFRNLSVLCLGIWLAVLALEALGKVFRQCMGRIRKFRYRCKRVRVVWSPTDLFVLLYGGAVLLSAACSPYQGTPWTGFWEWYMGAVSQLLFVGIYFFVSRCYDGREYPAYFWAGGFFLVTVFGILHRLGLDPLGLLKGFGTRDWTYSHMLSTVGNINWFCGYVSVALALPVAYFLKSRNRWQEAAFYTVSVGGLFLLFIQGSDIGVILTAVCLLVCLFWGLWDKAVFRRTFLLLAGMSFLLPAYGRLAKLLGERALEALPADSIGWRVIGSNVWWALGAAALVLWFVLRRADNLRPEDGAERAKAESLRPEEGTERAKEGGRFASRIRRFRIAAVALVFLALAAGAAYFLIRQPVGGMWGSGRGALWKTSLQAFCQNEPLRKLVGVGPDCFAEYLYSTFPGDAFPALDGRWAGTVYANAHNEWLNHLINLGIIGTGFYLGIFFSGAVRYRRNLAGILALAMYGTASLTGFQQCMNTPLLFMLLGMCESELRRPSLEEAEGEPEQAESRKVWEAEGEPE